MDDKKKIVLGSEDFLAKGIDDIYLNINLERTFRQIKRDKFDNDFDLAEQFRRERNASRSFRIYGIVDSTVVDCDSLPLTIYSDSGLTNIVLTTVTSPLGPGDKNVYGKQDGKYYIELNNYTESNEIFIKINGNGTTTADQVIQQTLVFFGADGEFIEYGTETVDIGFNGQFVTIENDFPFFYNKHWIKNNVQVEEVKPRNVSFEFSSYVVDEGNNLEVKVKLNQPSVFGNESIQVIITSPEDEAYDTAAPGIDFTPASYPIVTTLSWAAGEQDKIIDFDAILDSSVEKNVETVTLALTNNVNVNTTGGVVNITNTSINIVDKTPKEYVIYNFQKMIRNYSPIINKDIDGPNLTYSIPGIEMNAFGGKDFGGLTDKQQNYRFYPNDRFQLEIVNKGDSTTLPILPGITLNEQFLGAGQSIIVDIENKYENHDSLPLETAVFKFKELNGGTLFFSPTYMDNFYINGVKRFPPIQLAAEEFEEAANTMFESIGVDKVYNVVRVGKDVTLTANHPANNISAFIPDEPGGIFGGTSALLGNSNVPLYPDGRIVSITPQIPTELKLYANDGSSARYEFRIHKNGYKSVVIPDTGIPATPSGNEVYLVTPIRDVIAPNLPAGDSAVCDPINSSFDIEGYYLNGVALIPEGVLGYTDPQAKNEKIPAFTPQFRNNPLTLNIIYCNNLIEMSKDLS